MPFTDEEKRLWHEEKKRENRPTAVIRSEPVAVCVHCQNTLYYSAELLHYEAINGFTGGGDQPSSLRTLVGDIQRLVSHFNTFIFGFAALFLRRHLNRQLNDMRDRKTALEGVPHFDQLMLPYFTELPQPAEKAKT